MKHSNKNIIKSGILALFIVTMLAIGATKAQAGDTEQCREWHSISVKIMTERQNNRSVAEMMEIAKLEPSIEREITAIIAAAYDIQVVSNAADKEMVSNEFGNAVYMMCFRANGEKI
jgi:hypothetical protein